MPAHTPIDDDDDTTTVLDVAEDNISDSAEKPDNGNTPDTAEEVAAVEEARKKALLKVAAASEDDDDGEGQPGAMIPRTRFKEVNTRMQKAEAENAALRDLISKGIAPVPAVASAAAPAEPEFDLKATIRKKNAALASGDDDLADELDEKIQQHNVDVATKAALQRMQEENAVAAQRESQAAMERVAKDVKVAYPQLDEKSPQKNEEAIDFVVFKRDQLIARGLVAHKALAQAVENAATVFKFTAPKDGEPAAPTAEDKRIEEARRRNAVAAARQPPELGGTGERATAKARVNVTEMTDEQFAALPEAEKKRLRGDM